MKNIQIPNSFDEYVRLQRGLSIEEAIKTAKYDLSCILKIKPEGKSIIDVGCGLGLMMAHLDDQFKYIHLLDKTDFEEEKKMHGYGPIENFGFYNDLEFARQLVEENTNANVRAFSPENMPHYKYDVIISFYSWGFHYPVGVYIDWALGALKKDGAIILTVRDRIVDLVMSQFSDKDKVCTVLESRRASDLVCIHG